MIYPQELIARKQWVNWRLIPDKDGGKDKKVPFNPITGKGAASNNPATWTDFATAVDAVERYGFSGLGFMFAKDGGLVGVDIDHCYDPETKTFNDTAKSIMARQPTYMEFSPSGTGVHLFFKGKMASTGNKNAKTGVEMYEHTRYFTMTGKKLDGATDTIAQDNGSLQWIHETYIRAPKKQRRKRQKSTSIQLADEDLLELAQSAENGESFIKLWEGSWQGDYASQSEADMALCCRLAFWSGRDKQQMDRLFRQSGLFREKWDVRHHASGATYGEETMYKACELTAETYAPGGNAPVYEYKGQYFRTKGENTYPITNFVFVPVEMIVAEDETQLTANLVTVRGETYPLTFMTTDFANQQRFKNTLNQRTIALSYTGSDGDLELLKAYVSELDWPMKTGVKAMGIYKHDGGAVFVTTDGAVGASGAAVSDMVQLEKYRSIESRVLEARPLTKDQLQKLGERLMTYNEPAKTVPILAWMAGCFIKVHLRERSVKFPHLMLIGEAGSGKSNTLERVIMPVFSRSKIIAAGQTTAFTLMKDAASSNTIPMALDEFKPSKIDRYRMDALLNHFRNSYDGQEGIRGRADQSVVSYTSLENRSGESDPYGSVGAGDQGTVYGYATKETPEYLPLPIVLSQRIAKRIDECREGKLIKGILPDGKCQVTVEYQDDKPCRVKTVVVSVQHAPDKTQEQLHRDITNNVLWQCFEDFPLDDDTEILINPSGRFVEGGPAADTGLTGRKLMVDTYGGLASHGGGALCGKDPTKVDRSGAYMARYIAKNIVWSDLAEKCEVALSYAIGKATPVAVSVTSFGTGKLSDDQLCNIVQDVFNLRPAAIIEKLRLRCAIYADTASYGHFCGGLLPWENTDMKLCEELRKAADRYVD